MNGTRVQGTRRNERAASAREETSYWVSQDGSNQFQKKFSFLHVFGFNIVNNVVVMQLSMKEIGLHTVHDSNVL